MNPDTHEKEPGRGTPSRLTDREIRLLLDTLSAEEQTFVERGEQKKLFLVAEAAEVLADHDPDAPRDHIGTLLVKKGTISSIEYRALRNPTVTASLPAPAPPAAADFHRRAADSAPVSSAEQAGLTRTMVMPADPVSSAVNLRLAPGVYFGKYRILAELARGAMGIVFTARQEELDRIVCLKIILAGPLASRDQIDRFFREAQSAAKLSHPNIVPIYDLGELNGLTYYTMEYVNGRSLAQILDGGPLEAGPAAVVALNVARGLQFAHENGVIHRDIKPSNVLIKTNVTSGHLGPNDWDRAEIKVTDFGLARKIGKQTQQLTLAQSVMGTACYMSPEQARGEEDQITGRSDVYALGALLYEMLTGKAPLSDLPFNEILRRSGDEREMVPAPSTQQRGVDPVLEIICLKALRKNPKQRYATAGEMAEDLERYLKGEQITAKAPGFFERRGWSAGKTAAVAAAVLVVAGSGLAYYLTRPGVIKPRSISWTEAPQFVGKLVTVEIPVVRSFETPTHTALVPKPGDRTAFEARVRTSDYGGFPAGFKDAYWKKLVRVTGTVERDGTTPMINLISEKQVEVVRGLRGKELAGSVDYFVSMAQAYVPSGENLIRWTEATKYLDQTRTVEGMVEDARKTDNAVYLMFKRGDRTAFEAVVFERFWDKFPQGFETLYRGKAIQVAGKITTHQGQPMIYVNLPSQIKIVGEGKADPAQLPSRDNLISYQDALDHVGEYKTVGGIIQQAARTDSITFLDFSPSDRAAFSAVVFASSYPNFPDGFEALYQNKSVWIAGTIELNKGKPRIIVDDPSQIRVVDRPRASPEAADPAPLPEEAHLQELQNP